MFGSNMLYETNLAAKSCDIKKKLLKFLFLSQFSVKL